jgi:hypothetical protein
MLDKVAREEATGTHNDYEHLYEHPQDEALYHEHFTPPSDIFEAQSNGSDHPFADPSTMYESQVASRSGLIRGNSIENEIHGERSHGQQDTLVDDELAGFWKPNILY